MQQEVFPLFLKSPSVSNPGNVSQRVTGTRLDVTFPPQPPPHLPNTLVSTTTTNSSCYWPICSRPTATNRSWSRPIRSSTPPLPEM